MFNKSKLQNAKQKISKLKDKYLNTSKFSKDDDIVNLDLLEKDKPEKDQSKLDNFNEAIIPPVIHKIKSPRIEITEVLDDADYNKDEKISSLLTGDSHGLTLIDNQSEHDQISSYNSPSPSEHSYCSKITNKTLKTESIILSELSNQFENICFLSSSSDEDNTRLTGIHPTNSSFPQTDRNLATGNSSIGLLQAAVQHFDRHLETKQSRDLHEQEVSSSDLSEVQSDMNSTVYSNKENSMKIYSHPTNFEGNSDENMSREKENEINKNSENSYKKIKSDEKQTSISDPSFKFSSSIQTKDNSLTELSEKPLKEIKQPQPSPDTLRTKKHKRDKTFKHKYIKSNLELSTELNNCDDGANMFKIGDVTRNRHIDTTTVYSDKKTVHKKVSSLPKSSRSRRNKYNHKTSKTVFKHSTNMEASNKRPILKSCILVRGNEFNEENKFWSPSKLDGSDYEEVISQLLRNQVQLTRHFIHSHHEMYMTCCQAVKLLSEKYNN